MKAKIAQASAMLCLGLVLVATSSHADFLSDLMANPPRTPDVARQKMAAQDPVGGMKHGQRPERLAPQQVLPQRHNVVIAPEGVKTASPLDSAKSFPRPKAKPRDYRGAKASGQRSIVPNTRIANGTRPTRQQVAANRQLRESPPPRSYQGNIPSQAGTPIPASYGQPVQAGYYSGYQPQDQYTTTPNYNQRYSYQQAWGGAGQAGCGPGRL